MITHDYLRLSRLISRLSRLPQDILRPMMTVLNEMSSRADGCMKAGDARGAEVWLEATRLLVDAINEATVRTDTILKELKEQP